MKLPHIRKHSFSYIKFQLLKATTDYKTTFTQMMDLSQGWFCLANMLPPEIRPSEVFVQHIF